MNPLNSVTASSSFDACRATADNFSPFVPETAKKGRDPTSAAAAVRVNNAPIGSVNLGLVTRDKADFLKGGS